MNGEKSPLELWREKLEAYERDLAITADPAQKFQLNKLVEEAKAKIAELETTPMRQLPDTPPGARSSAWPVILPFGALLTCASGVGCLVWASLKPQPLTADMTVVPTDWRVVLGILTLVVGGLGFFLSLLFGRARKEK